MPVTKTYLWKEAPFLRLLVPLLAGILLQWYMPLSFFLLFFLSLACCLFVLVYFFLPLKWRYQTSAVNGLCLLLFIACLGSWLVQHNDIRNDKDWFAGREINKTRLVVRLLEPLVEKQQSFKALADVQQQLSDDSVSGAEGKVILYFKKDGFDKELSYGSQILVLRPLQEISNSGNPGSFNYKQYCLFQGITHQVYLTPADYIVLKERKRSFIDATIFQVRSKAVAILKQFIKGSKEQGLSEALLIGYKDDLDKNLVQAYSNTGVVHIIAISGLHLGIIYWILLLLTSPLKKRQGVKWVRFLVIVFFLWGFSLVAGGQASVLRSAVMFTCMAYGEVIARRASIYNTLALSAFLLLCYQPYWLWDVGFQLSYAAVLSIIIFFRPIYNLVYVQNKAFDQVWKLNSVTLAAQILTLPVSIYHFHQFPLLFLVANLIAVPLSSAVLIGEIVLVLASSIEPLASGIGWLLQKLLLLMNLYVECLNELSFAVWHGFSISIAQACLLYGIIAGISLWLMAVQKRGVWLAILCLSCFTVLRSLSFYTAYRQKELIVYNIPRYQAIDVIEGRNYFFIGDTALKENQFLRNFHLQPSRILHRVTPVRAQMPAAKQFEFEGKHILIIDSTLSFIQSGAKPVVDVLILSKSPRLYLNSLSKIFSIKNVVIDGSVPEWRKKYWKNDCDSLGLPYHDVSDKGAFVMKFQ